MLVMFVLGFFLDFLEIIFIVVPIVAPVLLQMEMAPGVPLNPVWLGVMMAVNLQTSFLTPPFGFALFYLRGVAPDNVRTIDIYRGVEIGRASWRERVWQYVEFSGVAVSLKKKQK